MFHSLGGVERGSRVSQERLTAIAAVAAITAHVTTGSFASVGLVSVPIGIAAVAAITAHVTTGSFASVGLVSVPIGLVRVGPIVGLLLNGTVLDLGAAVRHRRC
jgi:hypothetical protein